MCGNDCEDYRDRNLLQSNGWVLNRGNRTMYLALEMLHGYNVVQECSLANLPPEIMTEILSKLDQSYRSAAAMTCKKFNLIEKRVARKYRNVSIKGNPRIKWFFIETTDEDDTQNEIEFSTSYVSCTDLLFRSKPRDGTPHCSTTRFRETDPETAACQYLNRILRNSEIETLVLGMSGISSHIQLGSICVENLTLPINEEMAKIVNKLRPRNLNISFVEKEVEVNWTAVLQTGLCSLTSYYVDIPIDVQSLLNSSLKAVRLQNQTIRFNSKDVSQLINNWKEGLWSIEYFCLSFDGIVDLNIFDNSIERTNRFQLPNSFILPDSEHFVLVKSDTGKYAWLSHSNDLVSFVVTPP